MKCGACPPNHCTWTDLEFEEMYFTDRGIEELEQRRGDDQVTLGWLAERMRDFVDLNPEFDTAVERLATWLARTDDEDA